MSSASSLFQNLRLRVSFRKERGTPPAQKHLNDERSTSRGCWCGTKFRFFFFLNRRSGLEDSRCEGNVITVWVHLEV